MEVQAPPTAHGVPLYTPTYAHAITYSHKAQWLLTVPPYSASVNK